MSKKNLLKYTIALLTSLSVSIMSAQEKDTYSIPDLLARYNDQSVPYVQVDALHADLDQYVVLDTRKKKEYDVSHLPGALWVGERFDPKKLPQLDKNQKIVVYCSVGVRSENFGEQLQDAGFTQVFNLYGSIFSWKNAGYEVTDPSGTPTDSVHVYSKKWGNYLKKGVKVF
jgi:rhodanese-related sulfurtransferase